MIPDDDQDDEWLETEPDELYSNTGVVCVTCGKLKGFKHYIAKGKYTPACPSCRRKASNRLAQRNRRTALAKLAIIEAAALHRKSVAELRSVNSRINKLMAQARQQIMIFQPKVEAGTATPRTLRALEKREAQVAYYERIRERMLADAAGNALKPMEHYLQDEEIYATYIDRVRNTSKPTASKSGTARTDEPEGMEESA